jgi:toxin ParE1/3/4
MKVVWSVTALRDFDRLIAYIAARNPYAAARITTLIDRTARELGALQTGRQGRVAGTYEKIVSGLPYVMAYAIAPPPDADGVVILRIIHGARNWPPGQWPR